MPIAFVNRAEGFINTAGITSIATAAANHTTGNILVIFLSLSTSEVPTVTDTAGNTYTQIGSVANSGTTYIRLFRSFNITGNAANIVTASWGSGSPFAYHTIAVRQFSWNATWIVSDEDQATGVGTALATPSMTLSTSDGLSCVNCAGNLNLVAGTGYTLTRITDGFGGYVADEYHIVTASEAATATANSGTWIIKAAMFGGTPGNSGGGAGKGNNGHHGGGGVHILQPGGASIFNIGNPGLNIGST